MNFSPTSGSTTRQSGQPAGGLNDLHLRQPVPHLPAALSASLPRWLERAGTPAPRCLSSAPSNKPWAISAGRIPDQSCSRSGLPVRTRVCTTPTEIHGIACSGKLLTRFCQDDRIQVAQPRRNLQVTFTRPIAGRNDFTSAAAMSVSKVFHRITSARSEAGKAYMLAGSFANA